MSHLRADRLYVRFLAGSKVRYRLRRVRLARRERLDVLVREEVVPRFDEQFTVPVRDLVEQSRLRGGDVRFRGRLGRPDPMVDPSERLERRHHERDVPFELVLILREDVDVLLKYGNDGSNVGPDDDSQKGVFILDQIVLWSRDRDRLALLQRDGLRDAPIARRDDRVDPAFAERSHAGVAGREGAPACLGLRDEDRLPIPSSGWHLPEINGRTIIYVSLSTDAPETPRCDHRRKRGPQTDHAFGRGCLSHGSVMYALVASAPSSPAATVHSGVTKYRSSPWLDCTRSIPGSDSRYSKSSSSNRSPSKTVVSLIRSRSVTTR